MKEKLIILLAALALSLLLLLPSKHTSFCPFFVDENQDAICDILQTRPTEFDFSFWPQATVFTFLLALSILIQISGKLKWLRSYILIFSIFYFGFFWSKICPIATFQSLFLQKERVVLQLPLFLIFLLPVITTLLFGRVFCRFLCPLGGFQELIFRILGRKSIKIPKKLFYLPYIILLILILGTIHSSSLFFCQIEPWGQIFGCKTNPFSILLLFITLFFALLIFRPFCNFFCPLGVIFRFLEKFQIFKRNLKPEIRK